jgi:hypothetical protein
MSWEVMRTEAGPCECGESTQTFTFEMDDWNRTRSSIEIHCPKCRDRERRQWEADQAREKRRAELLRTAQQLASDRYLAKWLALFEGVTKKAAWERYTGQAGYPALGTFYQHIKHSGSLNKYMDSCFTNDLERSLRVLGVQDEDIDALLEERAQLWQPTSGPL